MKVYPAVKGKATGKINIPEEHIEKSNIKIGDEIEITSKEGVIEIRRVEC